MRFAGLIVLALAAQCLASPVKTLDDKYADLISDVFTWARQKMIEQNPTILPELGPQTISEGEVDLVIDQTNVLLSKAENFVVKEIKTDAATLTASVKLEVPSFYQTGDYSVDGTVNDKKVNGKGKFTVEATNIYFETTVTFENPESSLQITDIQAHYTIESAGLTLDDLHIEGYTDEQTNEFVETKLANIWKDESRVQQFSIPLMIQKLNGLMAGKTLEQVCAWVEMEIQQ